MDMGYRLKTLRESRGMSQVQLGKAVRREQQEISQLEKSGRLLAKDLPLFARALHVPVTAFYAEDDLNAVPGVMGQVDWGIQAAVEALPSEARAHLLGFVYAMLEQCAGLPASHAATG